MKILRYCVLTTLSVVLAVSLMACGPAIAATVNGEKIPEQEITDAIESVRSQTADYSTDVGWATALAKQSMTPATMRDSMIDSKVEEAVITQAALAAGLVADDTTIDNQIVQAKANVAANGSEWLTALQSAGFLTEEDYRNFLVTKNYYTQIGDSFVVDPTADELEQYVVANLQAFISKNADAAASIIGDYKIPKKGVVYKDVPEALISAMKEQMVNADVSAKLENWLTEQVDGANVVINDMPKGLPYDVDMSLASPSDSANPGDSASPSDSATNGTTDGTEGN